MLATKQELPLAPEDGFLIAPLGGPRSFVFNGAGNREDAVNFMINSINLNDQVKAVGNKLQ
jgi:hypothetical protein